MNGNTGMPIGTRVELQRWRTRCGEMFDRGLMEPKPETPGAEPGTPECEPEIRWAETGMTGAAAPESPEVGV